MADNSADKPKRRRGPGKPFEPGRSGNPGGRPPKLRDIEAMLDDEFRTVEEMRENYRIVKMVARGVDEPVYYKGQIVGYIRKYYGDWMGMLLDRLQGPVRELKIDLSDAPDEVVAYLAEKLN